MNFMIRLFLIFVLLNALPKCQPWVNDYQYNLVFKTSDLSQTPEWLKYTIPDENDLYIRSIQENTLLYQKIIENQIIADMIISEIAHNCPYTIKGQGDSFNNPPAKRVYFADYPHTKALLQLQWKRLRNSLFIHKLGSLRLHSPFHRP